MRTMLDERAMPSDPMLLHEDALTHIPRAAFVAGWRALVGEPPATMLESRSEMIRILVNSIPVAQPAEVSMCAKYEMDG